MSDNENDDETPSPSPGNGKKGKGNGKEPPDHSATVTPQVRDQELYEFLVALFYDDPEPEQFPERVELNVVSGRYATKIETTIWAKQYAPIRATGEAVKRGAGAAKPSREVLAALSNLLLEKMRRNCDEFGNRAFAVHAWSTSRDGSPYMAFPKKMTPGGRYARKDGETDDDEDLTREQKFILQLFGITKQSSEMYFDAFAGLVDRYSRDKERDSTEIDRLHRKLAEKNDQLERALSFELDREERRDGMRQKREIIDKGMHVVETYGPVLAASLMGKKMMGEGGAPPSDEAAALREFLCTTEQGGRATSQQLLEAFGDWENGRQLKPGILSADQAMIIVLVAGGKLAVDELDKLVPGGPLEITMAQGAQLMRVFGDQLEPLMKVFASRQKKKEK